MIGIFAAAPTGVIECTLVDHHPLDTKMGGIAEGDRFKAGPVIFQRVASPPLFRVPAVYNHIRVKDFRNKLQIALIRCLAFGLDQAVRNLIIVRLRAEAGRCGREGRSRRRDT